jgi:hypothetical protein
MLKNGPRFLVIAVLYEAFFKIIMISGAGVGNREGIYKR